MHTSSVIMARGIVPEKNLMWLQQVSTAVVDNKQAVEASWSGHQAIIVRHICPVGVVTVWVKNNNVTMGARDMSLF